MCFKCTEIVTSRLIQDRLLENSCTFKREIQHRSRFCCWINFLWLYLETCGFLCRSLLETTKPYLVGCLRTPALQTLLLYSSSLDTNTDCKRVLCDGWLELRFLDSESAEQALSSAVQLRSTWQALIQTKLEGRLELLK